MYALHHGQDASRVLPEPEAALYCGVPLSTWRKMRRTGLTPSAIQISPRRRGYTLGSLHAWQSVRTVDAHHRPNPEARTHG